MNELFDDVKKLCDTDDLKFVVQNLQSIRYDGEKKHYLKQVKKILEERNEHVRVSTK